MSHGRLFRIASEWQKKKKTIWRVWSGMRKTWKMRAAALLLTAVCTVGASFAAYAPLGGTLLHSSDICRTN